MRKKTADDDQSEPKSPGRLEILGKLDLVLEELEDLLRLGTSGHMEATRAVEMVFDEADRKILEKLFAAAGWDKKNACRRCLSRDRVVIAREKDAVRGWLADRQSDLTETLQYVETSSGLPQSLDCRRVPWPRQPHMEEEPYGIQVKSAWNLKKKEGATGEGVAFALVDEGVDVLHPDFPKEQRSVHVIKGSQNLPEFAHHGTKALGIVAAKRGWEAMSDEVNDGDDVTGIAYNLPYIGFSSVRQKRFRAYNEPRAILRAIYWLHGLEVPSKLGKILLIERFMSDRSQDPIDVHCVIRCLIKLAVACRIVVVIPAGNGQEPLAKRSGDDDSGAIIVGAALPLYQDPRHKPAASRDGEEGEDKNPRYQVEAFSNHGPGVDCYAWGRCIRTTAFNGGYSDFDGTSGAAAIVAGMAALVQSLVIKWQKPPLRPCCVREVLRDRANGIPIRSEEQRAVPTMKRIVENLKRFRCPACGTAQS